MCRLDSLAVGLGEARVFWPCFAISKEGLGREFYHVELDSFYSWLGREASRNRGCDRAWRVWLARAIFPGLGGVLQGGLMILEMIRLGRYPTKNII